jgi:drug/metabolite transporter (DMT)-like permease
MLLVGNGCVVWSEQRVPSGLAALLVAAVPIWMVLLDWLWRGGPKPGAKVAAGIAFGMIGLGMLVGPSDLLGGGRIDPFGAGALLAATLSWSVGSIYSRDADLPKSPILATGMEMLGGGVLLMILGLFAGDHTRLDLGAVSVESVFSLAYLIVFGSIVAFSAYVWLLGATTPARVATYAYVNPIVAVFLGWGFGNEPLTPRTFVAVAVVLVGVVLITLKRKNVTEKSAEQKVLSAEC